MKMIIVEDEKIIREQIAASIQWSQYGIDVIGTAENGSIALKMARTFKPEIILSDIRMPEMDGLELLIEVQKEMRGTKVVLLTAYDDFKYVQTALKNGAFDYVLKIVPTEELINTVLKARDKVLEEQKKTREAEVLKANLKENVQIANERLLNRLVSHKSKNINYVVECLNKNGILFKNGHYFVVIVDFNQTDIYLEIERYSLVKMKMLEIENKLSRGGIWYFDEKDRLIGIIQHENSISFSESSNSLKKALIENEITNYYVGVGLSKDTIENIYDSYCEAEKALEFKIVKSKNAVITYSEILYLQKKGELTGLIKDCRKDLYVQLKSFSENKIKDSIDKVFEELILIKSIHPNELYQFCYELIQEANRDIAAFDPEFNSSVSEYDFYSDIRQYDDIQMLKEWLKELISSIVRRVHNNKEEPVSQTISKVLNFIDENIGFDLNLKAISEKFEVNQSCLSILFKNKTGTYFKDYILKKKMERALILLKDSRLRIKEVSVMVGYQDEKYFTNIFKKLTGMTPSQYKNNKETPQVLE